MRNSTALGRGVISAAAHLPEENSSTNPSRFGEDGLFLRGQGRFIDDVVFPDMLHVAFVRSPHARARICAVNTETASLQPGVVAVLTGDAMRSFVNPIYPLMTPGSDYEYQPTEWYPLAWDQVRYVGEAVAAVVAVDRYQAEDGAALVDIEFEPLPEVIEATKAMDALAPLVHSDTHSNVLFHIHHEATGGKEAFEQAVTRVKCNFRHPRVAAHPVEGCGVVAKYLPVTDELEVWTSTQVPHLIRNALSRALRHPMHRLHVFTPDLGGAFGLKMQALPEEIAIAYLSRLLHRPVKWTQDRGENLRASFHARDALVEAELAAESNGTIIGMQVKVICDVGAYNVYPVTSALEPLTALSALPGPYYLPYFKYDGYAIATNKCPSGAYRGVGFTLAGMVTEGLMNKLAKELGMDPVDLRLKNFIEPSEFPFRNQAGVTYDSGDYSSLLKKAVKTAGYKVWQQDCRAMIHRASLFGIGVAFIIEPTGMGRSAYRRRGMIEMPAFDTVRLSVTPDGYVEAYTSTPSQGQSQSSTFKLLLGQAMGVSPDFVSVKLGNSSMSPYGSGTYASRSVVSGGGALLKAVQKLQEKLIGLASIYWGIDQKLVHYRDGSVVRDDRPMEHLSLSDLGSVAYTSTLEFPIDWHPGLEVNASYSPLLPAMSSSAHLVLVEVNAETGQVTVLRYVVAEDCGPIINTRAVEGQLIGGVVQGLGTALLEEVVYDEKGQLLTSTLMDYLAPMSVDIPDIQVVHMETPSPFTEGGYKGMGESGIIGAPAAIASAVLDAIKCNPYLVQLPFTPDRVLMMMRMDSKHS
ncbi:xanthine dehydrogenase family protein molybdopterin-binding subunit [Dehalococcoidia bacterium]|nr:xanthine dehydrogenase family protein molybdopterin-binding subunit [Dehalococcoidia bacterium]